MPKKIDRFPTNYEYLVRRMKEEHISQKDMSALLGKSPQYISYMKSTNTGLTNDDIKVIQDLMDIDMKQLIVRKDTINADSADIDLEKVATSAVNAVNSKIIDNLVIKIGQLEQRMKQFEERLEKPAIVTIPMNAKDMAILTMRDLLDGGWTTKDDVLRAFNEKHIPIEYISDALKANNAISATSGVADRARTFYIAQ